jgi:hypothetical protein
MTKGWRKGIPTERQRFIIDARESGMKLNDIKSAYEKQFGVKIMRERIRSILAQFGKE